MNYINGICLEVGDMIGVTRFGYTHVGIFVGPRRFDGYDVVHNDKGNAVILSSQADFAQGSPIQIWKKASGNIFEREAIANRALALLGRRFDLLMFNCEHAANLAQSGRAESPQLVGAAFLGLALLGLFALSRRS
jgi:hypothetical protein